MSLLHKINHAWRWLGTAFSFFMFGVGGVILLLIVMPFLHVLPGDYECREQRAQRIVHNTFRLFIGLMKALGVLSYRISGLENLKGAKLVLANHPSLIDVVFLIAMIPNANCIVKGRLTRNPFTRGAVKAAGYIMSDDSADVIDAAQQVFAKGQILIIFPEGTRTQPLQPVQLQRGAAHVAVRADADVTPVVIECNPTTLTKSDSWYQVPDRRVHFNITIKCPIAVNQYQVDVTPSKGVRMLTRDLTNFFNKESGFNE
jgi:1-acyl-sn-glycerol-3-phosphate acyltransferase